MTDDELIAGFESASLASLPHREHVRVSWIYLERIGLHAALAAVSRGLRGLSIAHGQAAKYHETVSWLYVFAIHERMRPEQGWEEFAAANPDLFAPWGGFVRRYYSAAKLSSKAARASFVLPDRLES
jgi:hypothetical protein